jgi:hypothetical protein
MNEVRKELNTSDQQNKQIEELNTELQNQFRAAFGNINFQEMQDLKPEERQKRFAEVRKKSEEAGKKADEKLKAILDAKQWTRLEQLQFQRDGIAALNRPEIAKQLGLTDEQKRKIGDAARGGFGPFGPGPEARDKALADAVALLTAEQKAKWQELRGKDFKFPAFGGFGGPMGQKRALVKKFDKNRDGRLNAEERQAARESLKKDRAAGGPGGRPRPSGVELDPLIGLDDARKPLRSRLLAVPSLRARYLAHVRTLAEDALDWNKLGPVVARYRTLLDKEIEADTRKLSSHEAFQKAVAGTLDTAAPQGRRPSISLRAFAEQRRRYLLNHAEVKSAANTR